MPIETIQLDYCGHPATEHQWDHINRVCPKCRIKCPICGRWRLPWETRCNNHMDYDEKYNRKADYVTRQIQKGEAFAK